MELLLVRHGESAANMNRLIHKEIADHAIPLTDKGMAQASSAALKVNNYLQQYDTSLTEKDRPNIGL
jgi:broad specificity phosphatase PhoE